MDRVTEFYSILAQLRGLQAGKDVLRWQGRSSGDFEVNVEYKMMNQFDHWPWKHIWRTNIRHKVSCFVWLLAKEVVLTQDNLMRSNITMCPRFFLCEVEAETVNHLFLHCRVMEHSGEFSLTFQAYPGSCQERLQKLYRVGRKQEL